MIGKVLTIAGSDSVGGAGIQADIKTITMHGCYAMSVITALTAQNTTGVSVVLDVPADFVEAQLNAVFTDVFPDAVKIGMVSNRDCIEVIAACLQHFHPQSVVVDPVMISTSGHPLLRDDAMNELQTKLLPLAAVITPNLPEAEALLHRPITCLADMKAAALELAEQYQNAVLIKGGHLSDCAADVLCSAEGLTVLTAPRIRTHNTHGTGCTLSSAIASNLAKGKSIPDSVRCAKNYITGALQTGFDIGKGNGPLLQNYALL